MKPYIYEPEKNSEIVSEEVILMLPDIYAQTDYSKKTAQDFATTLNRKVFLIDYFYTETEHANTLDPNADGKFAQELMMKLNTEKFVELLKNVKREIVLAHQNIQNFSVIGFCFGGRLAYIAGAAPAVTKIFSFYGPGANTPNYVYGKSPIEFLIENKKGKDMRVISFYGTNDPTIPEEDRLKTKQNLEVAGIYYEPHEYNAGHAYFQEGRKNFNDEASKASWEVLKKYFN